MAKDLRSFLEEYEASCPEDVIHIDKEVNSNQEITGIVEHLEKLGKYPLLIFHNVLNAEGKKAELPLATNILASRTRYARICNSTYETLGQDVYEATRVERRTPVTIRREEAPVKEVIKTGDRINLFEFPALLHNDMDSGYYVSGGFLVTYDPDSGIDNCSIQRGWIKEKDLVVVDITPRPTHNGWNLYKHESRNQDMKVAYWIGHHPLAYIGGLTKLPYPGSHWEAIGGMLRESLRLVPSESLGDDFLVPADAEVIVEGIIEGNKRYAEGPFGEFTGYYGPQILSPRFKVTAITHRKDAKWYNIMAAHADHSGAGSPPLEGLLWANLKPRFPSLQRVYVPLSGTGRYHAYLQLKNPGRSEARQAIMLACNIRSELIKHVFAFDGDIDIFNPRDVMWAIATRTQWCRDVITFPQAKMLILDPSIEPDRVSDIGGIDCTKPWGEPYEERVGIDQQVLERLKLENFISPEALARVSTERM
jgi:2,5-furandicarboxylate decarboxylase 1